MCSNTVRGGGQSVSFGERLGVLRRDAGITQAGLAEAIGSAQSTVSQLEAGSRKPSYNMLQDLAKALNVSPAYLLSDEMEELTAEEEAHFREYRTLTPEAREELREYAAFLRQKLRRSRSKGP